MRSSGTMLQSRASTQSLEVEVSDSEITDTKDLEDAIMDRAPRKKLRRRKPISETKLGRAVKQVKEFVVSKFNRSQSNSPALSSSGTLPTEPDAVDPGLQLLNRELESLWELQRLREEEWEEREWLKRMANEKGCLSNRRTRGSFGEYSPTAIDMLRELDGRRR